MYNIFSITRFLTIFAKSTAIAIAVAMLGLSNAAAVIEPLTQDAFVASASPTSNFGGWGSVNVNGSGARGLLSFRLDSNLPSGTTAAAITKVSLVTFVEWLDAPGSIEFVRLNAPFDEGAVTFVTMPSNTGLGTGRTVALTGSIRPLVVDVTDMVKAALTAKSSTISFAVMPAASTPKVAVQLGSKEGKRNTFLDITLVQPPAALVSFWATTDKRNSCRSTCPTDTIAAADGSGNVCKNQSGFLSNNQVYGSIVLFGVTYNGERCGDDWLAQCNCIVRPPASPVTTAGSFWATADKRNSCRSTCPAGSIAGANSAGNVCKDQSGNQSNNQYYGSQLISGVTYSGERCGNDWLGQCNCIVR